MALFVSSEQHLQRHTGSAAPSRTPPTRPESRQRPSDSRISWTNPRSHAAFAGGAVGRSSAAGRPEGSPRTGGAHLWVAGEHGAVRRIRQDARERLGLPRERSVAVPYWRRGAGHDRTDEEIATTLEWARERSIPLATTWDVTEPHLDRVR